MTKKVHENIRRAREILSDESKWFQGGFAYKPAHGQEQVCLVEALWRGRDRHAAGTFNSALQELSRLAGLGTEHTLGRWNDSHTFAEVQALLDRALEENS